jgi:hypothetical protein
MEQLMDSLAAHFGALQDRMACFTRHGVQTEGWFKGEMLLVLDGAQQRGLIAGFDREVLTGRKRIDLRVDGVGGGHWWVELKHWLIGRQKGTSYGPGFYFGDRSSVGILPDVDKLLGLRGSGEGRLLILAAANPGPRAWGDGIRLFNEKFAPRRLRALSAPTDFPGTYFLGLLAVEGAAV